MRKPSIKKTDTPLEPFEFGCSIAVFPAEEIAALNEHGSLLTALAAGKIKPANAEQKRFLQVHREEAEPESVLEKAWVRLKNRREYEREENEATPATPPQDYGIVEFDADRCWW